MFDEYNPYEGKMFQVMDNDGKIINEKYMPELSDKELVEIYKKMLFARTADLMAVSYQRQGRMYTYPPNLGQEAISLAAALNMKDDDWMIPAFREMGGWIEKGVKLRELFMYFMGYEDGSKFEGAKNIIPISVPIASQLTHGAGIAYSIKYKKEDTVAVAFVGDGGTSEGDFHEALNFAAVWKAPLITIIQNNQFAISVPLRKQTVSKSLAIKGIAYGVKSIQVDGNDFFAMYKASKEAIEYARAGNGPVLIEAVTYRKGAHTTSDDPSKYRTKEEEQEWDLKDPLKRLKAYLVDKGLYDEKEEDALISQYKKEIDKEFDYAENYGPYKFEDVFKYMYADMPEDLKEQKRRHEKFLKWKEASK